MAVITDSLARLPIVSTFAVIAVFGVLVAAALLWAGEKFIPAHVRDATANGVRNLLAVVAAFYGFLIGFVVVQEWSNVSNAQSQVSAEAAAFATGSFAAATLPAPNSLKIMNGFLALGRSEVCDEVPSLEIASKPNLQTSKTLFKLYQVVGTVKPLALQSLSSYGQVYSSLNDVTSARRQMINASSERVPFVLMGVILLAGLVLLTAVSLQDVRHGRVHVMVVIAVALFVALGQGLVVSLSRPYVGAAAVSTDALTEGIPQQFQRCNNPELLTSPRQLG